MNQSINLASRHFQNHINYHNRDLRRNRNTCGSLPLLFVTALESQFILKFTIKITLLSWSPELSLGAVQLTFVITFAILVIGSTTLCAGLFLKEEFRAAQSP